MNDKNSVERETQEQGQQNLRQLIIVVNGKEVTVQTNVNAPLQVAVEKALQESQNVARPLEDWRLKYGDQILDLKEKLKNYSIPAGAVLFLSLNAGQGG